MALHLSLILSSSSDYSNGMVPERYQYTSLDVWSPPRFSTATCFQLPCASRQQPHLPKVERTGLLDEGSRCSPWFRQETRVSSESDASVGFTRNGVIGREGHRASRFLALLGGAIGVAVH